MDDDVYRKARIRAAERGTSVSAMVRQFLLELDTSDTDFQRRKRAQAQAIATIRAFRAGDRLTRDEVHGRDALR